MKLSKANKGKGKGEYVFVSSLYQAVSWVLNSQDFGQGGQSPKCAQIGAFPSKLLENLMIFKKGGRAPRAPWIRWCWCLRLCMEPLCASWNAFRVRVFQNAEARRTWSWCWTRLDPWDGRTSSSSRSSRLSWCTFWTWIPDATESA